MPRFHWPYKLLTAAYSGGIFFLSSQSNLPDQAPSWLDFPSADKVVHFLLYAGLGAIVWTGLYRSNVSPVTRLLRIVPVAFATVYGLSDEIHQLFVPNRSFDPFDLLADAIGATICVTALEFWRRHRAGGGTLAQPRP